eukprot:501275_1
MGWCSTVLFRIYASKLFIQEFLSQFTWRGEFNVIIFKGRGILFHPEDFNPDYNIYSVHYKYYYDTKLNRGLLSSKKLILKTCTGTQMNDSAIDTILSYSETYSGEICYTFKIWKDNFLCMGQPNGYGAAYNIRKIYQKILRENKHIQLELDKNFNITCYTIERYNLLMLGYDQKKLFQFLNGTDVSSCRDLYEYQPSCLPTWNTPYPTLTILGVDGVTATFVDIGNQFCNDEWIDHIKIIKRKLKKMNDKKFGKKKLIVLKKLKNKIMWNGVKGQIINEYDFKKERWPICIENKTVLIKTVNLVLYKEFKDNIYCGNKVCGKSYYIHKYGESSNDVIGKWYKCSACKRSFYCSRRCQKYDWNKFKHRDFCT